MLTPWDLDEAVEVVAAVRDAVGEPVTWRSPAGGGEPPEPPLETPIRALFLPVPLGLVSAGLYLKTDLTMFAGVVVAPGDEILRFGESYQVLESPFAHHLSDRVIAYETKVRKV